MNLKFTVFSAHDKTTTTQATLPGGQPVAATVPSFEVQVVDLAGTHGTLALTFVSPDEIAAAKAVFVPGRDITLTFA